jgi:hypothetical protein
MSASPEEMLDAMLDQGDPEAWKFQEDGPRVKGKLLSADSAPTKHGNVPILVLEVEGKPRSVWLMHTAVRNKVKRAFENGSLAFGIEHKGKAESKDGTEYEDYDVRIVPIGEGRGLSAFGSPMQAPAALEAGEAEAEVVDEGSTWGSGGGTWAQ